MDEQPTRPTTTESRAETSRAALPLDDPGAPDQIVVPEEPDSLFDRLAYSKGGARILAIGSVIGGLLLWELVARAFYEGRTALFAGPSQIWEAAWELIVVGDLQRHVLVSGYELLAGLLLAIVVGVAFGFLMAVSRIANRLLDPWVSAFYATPRIAIAPLLIIWLGIGPISKMAVVFLSAVFPVLMNTVTGLRVVDRNLLEVGESYGARGWSMFRTIQLPSAMPFVLSGIRLGYGRGLVGVVVGELMGATAGIGWLIYTSGQVLNTPRLLVGVVVLMIAGVGGNAIIKAMERRFTGWAITNENKK